MYPTARWTGFFQPYLLAGVGYMFGDVDGGFNDDDNGIAGRFGVGIDWYLTEHFYMTTDGVYLLPGMDATEFDQVIVGGALNYRF